MSLFTPHQVETARFAHDIEEKYVMSNGYKYNNTSWRLKDKERAKTVGAALISCLNIGFDPPDVVRPEPCARLECWIDPTSVSRRQGRKIIGSTLQSLYERWQSRVKYRVFVDPSPDNVRKLCTSLRKTAGNDRVLFHYNGHGVPKPTINGELWAYNSSYTQYVPFLIYDLQTWMGAHQPSIYVFDCSAAGIIVDEFQQFMLQRENNLATIEKDKIHNNDNNTFAKECQHILLAACAANETLPVDADWPADLFTSCLITPIKMALYWFSKKSKLVHLTLDMIDKIPGRRKPNNRKSPFGQLNWIFTAITDCIAWDVLPRVLFQRLFRQDLLVASLFRNFLLAQRIMRSFNLNTISSPKLPNTHDHAMWKVWDMVVELTLANLQKYVIKEIPFKESNFFDNQLTAINLWLTHANANSTPLVQLPILLQVLLSPWYRLRALYLLACLIDKGDWAISQALSVGIFPYVLKLLQIPDRELRDVLIFIWAKILQFDPTVQIDLVKADYCQYFFYILCN